MSEEIKKNLRTQGKYSDVRQKKEKRQKESPVLKETLGKKMNFEKDSTERQEDAACADNSDNESPVKYEENSDYSFEELEEQKKPLELRFVGQYALSETDNGTSTIIFDPSFIDEADAFYLQYWLNDNIVWSEKNIVIRGVKYRQPRLVAWYGPFPYTYSGATLEPALMPPEILEVKKRVEAFLKLNSIETEFNSVLLNCYRDGNDSVAWHSDDELSMGVSPIIASVSLGATRKFEMRKKFFDEEDEQDTYFINLTHGSLLVMDGSMQQDWQHRVPKEYHARSMRINLTFRKVHLLENSPSQVLVRDSEIPSNMNEGSSSSDIKNLKSTEAMFENGDFPELTSAHSKTTDNLQNRVDQSEYFDANSSPQNASLYANNLNYDGQDVKHDMPNKNVSESDNSFNNEEAMDKNDSCTSQYYSAEDQGDNSMNSSANSIQDNNNTEANSSQRLNVNAAEFVPITSTSYDDDENDDFNCGLVELTKLHFYNYKGDVLKNYAYALKEAIQHELTQDFKEFDFKEFEFLSALTDGSQTDKNQKLIIKRMHMLVKRYGKPPRFSSKPQGESRQRFGEHERGHRYYNNKSNFRHEHRQRSSEDGREYRQSSSKSNFSENRQRSGEYEKDFRPSNRRYNSKFSYEFRRRSHANQKDERKSDNE